MARTFEEMCAERDPLYAAMRPLSVFEELRDLDRCAIVGVTPQWRRWYQQRRDQMAREIQYRVNELRRQPHYFQRGDA